MLINNNKIVYLSPHTVTRYFDVLVYIGFVRLPLLTTTVYVTILKIGRREWGRGRYRRMWIFGGAGRL